MEKSNVDVWRSSFYNANGKYLEFREKVLANHQCILENLLFALHADTAIVQRTREFCL